MSDLAAFKEDIEAAWEARETLSPGYAGKYREAVDKVLGLLDNGRFRVAEKKDGPNGSTWITHDWLKKAVLLSFRLNANALMHTGRGLFEGSPIGPFWDKVPNKFARWSDKDFQEAGFRAVPGAIVRAGAFVGKNVVLMPSFVNIGAYVDEGTMVDTWATVGSCAQVGKNVHLSGGVGIGGVLEPLQAAPTIIEDNCFIGARSEVVEGCIVREGSVLGMGVYIGKSTRIVDRATGEIFYGEVPPYSVVVAGSMPSSNASVSAGANTPAPNLYCAVIVKRVDAQTRSKTGVNELLRD
ncbi:MAG TPA: 2,3,4,5-tetrahydropyridine-2,6-dicarboxylate N-succinyltransferase [Asticcacaulis sp.]